MVLLLCINVYRKCMYVALSGYFSTFVFCQQTFYFGYLYDVIVAGNGVFNTEAAVEKSTRFCSSS